MGGASPNGGGVTEHINEALRLANDERPRQWVGNVMVFACMAFIVGTLLVGAAGVGVWW